MSVGFLHPLENTTALPNSPPFKACFSGTPVLGLFIRLPLKMFHPPPCRARLAPDCRQLFISRSSEGASVHRRHIMYHWLDTAERRVSSLATWDSLSQQHFWVFLKQPRRLERAWGILSSPFLVFPMPHRGSLLLHPQILHRGTAWLLRL
uniref:Uncharacterized protein n=1 Tax=Micrurus carvalhoi TaxID=3147026 RepID=A0A2H6N4A2_9SAUR